MGRQDGVSPDELYRSAGRVMRRLATTVACAVVFAGAATCGGTYAVDDFELGTQRAVIEERFGSPLKVDTIIKTTEVVFGPIESFWSEVRMGGTVEIWSYPGSNGTVELYFTEGSAVLQGLSFLDDRAVY